MVDDLGFRGCMLQLKEWSLGTCASFRFSCEKAMPQMMSHSP